MEPNLINTNDMREFLEKYKEEYTLKIPQLLEEVKLKTHYTKWSKTILSAYQLEPFETELLGYKLGRFLKNEPPISKHVKYYFFDSEDKIVGRLEYNFYNNYEKEWVVTRFLYIYIQGGIFEIKLSSSHISEEPTKINRITYVKLLNDKVIESYNLHNDNRFSKLVYKYSDNRIVSIERDLWIPNLLKSTYEIEYLDQSAYIIWEIEDDDTKIKIYPKS
ncbi:hypothetical protein [uncultured Capnocytophaga sp.]|uniref:hypothetical protein n=1 Tax=uncultured Capnocytophaga sp. TaxID=159273 RepID=UPI00260DEB34|nr:hypothetical protein [uncultured Capnocytophaga sp.]